MLDFLRQEGISETIIREIEDFRAKWPMAGAVTALLCGENPLPAGPKAMGKAENGAARCVFDKKWLKATIDCLNVNRMRFTFRGF